MSFFETERAKEDHEVNEICEEQSRKSDEEIRRRKWSIEQAVMVDNSSSITIIETAKKIYNYAFGE